MIVKCAYCNNECEKSNGHANRAIKEGLKLYCNKRCSGLGRRISRDLEEKKRLKSEYDKKYRSTSPTLKQRKADYHARNYNSEKQKEYNKIRYPKHLEYLQRPEYKKWKHEYDQKYRAAKLYGEFSEAAIILSKLENELNSKKIKQSNGITFNKSSQQRKRKWNNLQVKT